MGKIADRILGIAPQATTSLVRKSKRVGGRISPKKPKSMAKLKKELDQVYSLYIRAKYPKKCYTCGRTGVLQCGHFISRSYLATRWTESNTRPQCIGCNLFGGGKPLDFEENLKQELGEEVIEAMKQSRHQILKLSRQWYESEIARYKGLLDNL